MSIAGKPFEMDKKLYEQIKFISPNLYELRKIADTLKVSPDLNNDLKVENVKTTDDKRKVFHEIVELCAKLQHIDNIIVTAGIFGVFVQRSRESESAFFTEDLAYIEGEKGAKICRHYPGKAINNIVNASGAGDAFCAGFITGMLKKKPESICISVGLQAAMTTLMSKRAVPKKFFDAEHACWKIAAEFEVLNNHQ
jgi:sugar/nucleoside kinase (ribokinase family)